MAIAIHALLFTVIKIDVKKKNVATLSKPKIIEMTLVAPQTPPEPKINKKQTLVTKTNNSRMAGNKKITRQTTRKKIDIYSILNSINKNPPPAQSPRIKMGNPEFPKDYSELFKHRPLFKHGYKTTLANFEYQAGTDGKIYVVFTKKSGKRVCATVEPDEPFNSLGDKLWMFKPC